jgi:hypothetical protein
MFASHFCLGFDTQMTSIEFILDIFVFEQSCKVLLNSLPFHLAEHCHHFRGLCTFPEWRMRFAARRTLCSLSRIIPKSTALFNKTDLRGQDIPLHGYSHLVDVGYESHAEIRNRGFARQIHEQDHLMPNLPLSKQAINICFTFSNHL